jgi:membrane-associated phospholipid phosphatase
LRTVPAPNVLSLGWKRIAVPGIMLVALAALVATGHMERIDQWSVNHLMPYQDRPVGQPTTIDQLMSPLSAVARPSNDAVARTLFAVTLPVAPLPAAMIGGLGVFALVGTMRRRRALAWAVILVSASVVEVAIKDLVERPLLQKFDAAHGAVVAKDSFNHSFPSGHTVRGILLAMLLAEVAPRFRTALMIWVVAMSAALVVASMHTPSDVVGGVLVALLMIPLLDLFPTPAPISPARSAQISPAEAADSEDGRRLGAVCRLP